MPRGNCLHNERSGDNKTIMLLTLILLMPLMLSSVRANSFLNIGVVDVGEKGQLEITLLLVVNVNANDKYRN